MKWANTVAFPEPETAPPMTNSYFQHPFRMNNPPTWLLFWSPAVVLANARATMKQRHVDFACNSRRPLKSVNSLLIHNRASITLSSWANQWHPWSCVSAGDAHGNAGTRDDKCCGQTRARAQRKTRLRSVFYYCTAILCLGRVRSVLKRRLVY